MYETHDAPTATLTPAEQVVALITQRGEPATIAQLAADLKPLKKPAVEQLVQELVDRRELFVVDPQERTKRYWTRDLGEQIRARAEECLSPGPRAEKDVVAAVKQALGKMANDKMIKAQLAEMVAQHRLYRHPGKGRTAGPLALRPFDPLAALTLKPTTMNELRSRFETMRDHDVSVEAFLVRVGELVFPDATMPILADATDSDDGVLLSAPVTLTESVPAPAADVELANLLLKAMQETGTGIPVPVADLRLQM
ncbi:MAG: hypothetical protein U0736_11150, partial [Gemmataceae bacterium]